ncbi:MAG: hypothetical protein R2806_06365 [Saprospiraceae bacterium]
MIKIFIFLAHQLKGCLGTFWPNRFRFAGSLQYLLCLHCWSNAINRMLFSKWDGLRRSRCGGASIPGLSPLLEQYHLLHRLSKWDGLRRSRRGEACNAWSVSIAGAMTSTASFK